MIVVGDMYWFLTDDSNRDPAPGKFFIYGGIVIPTEAIPMLHSRVEAIRKEHGYLPGDQFKFNSNSAPKHIKPEQVTAAKSQALKLLDEVGAKFVGTVVLSEVIPTKAKKDKTVLDMDIATKWGVNSLVIAFHMYLKRASPDAWGAMYIDRDSTLLNHLSELFQHGVKPTGYNHRVDDAIHLFAMTNDNSSHLSSLTDIAVGAFRFLVDAAGGIGSEATAVKIMADLDPLFLSDESVERRTRREFGFLPRPKEVRVPGYKKVYENLETKLFDFYQQTLQL
jgi:hypothetical protein